MHLYSSITLINNTYHVQVGPRILEGTSAFTPAEQEALAKAGEPVVEVGGTFTDSPLTFTLSEEDRLFPSQFPVKQLFSLDDDDDAGDMAVLFRDTIKTRIEAAMESARTAAIADTVFGSEISDINTTPAP